MKKELYTIQPASMLLDEKVTIDIKKLGITKLQNELAEKLTEKYKDKLIDGQKIVIGAYLDVEKAVIHIIPAFSKKDGKLDSTDYLFNVSLIKNDDLT